MLRFGLFTNPKKIRLKSCLKFNLRDYRLISVFFPISLNYPKWLYY